MAITLYIAHLTANLALVIAGLVVVAIGATALIWMLGAMHAGPSARAVAHFRTA